MTAGLPEQARVLRVWALVVLVPVAVIGAVLSFQSLYRAAVPVFGDRLALGFPLLVDFLILGASLQYVAGAKVGRPLPGWRLTAHAGVVGTLALNAMAASSVGEVPWHVTAPAVWSVLVELTAREVLGQWRATHSVVGERIPARLWVTAPVESARTWLRLVRRLDGEQARARLDVGVHAAAVEALKLALPQRRARRVRRILQRQLRAGSLSPAAVLGPLGWTDTTQGLPDLTPQGVLRAVLRETLLDQSGPARLTPATEPVEPVEPIERVNPIEPVEPVARVESVESVESVEPVERVESVERAGVAGPVRRERAGRRVGRSDEQIAEAVAVAVAEGRLPVAPSAEAVRVAVGCSWARAARVLRSMDAAVSGESAQLQVVGAA